MAAMNDFVLLNVPRVGVGPVFNEAQNDINSHARLRKELCQIYSQKPTQFMREFLKCVAVSLSYPKENPSAEKVVNFVTTFLAENSQKFETLLVSVFNLIVENHSCKSLAVRYRCCDLVYHVLINMDNQAGLDAELFEKIASCMLEGLQDKAASVRSHAVMALHRLQSPNDPECPIIKAFLFSMEFDPSSDVRAKVVRNIAATRKTLPSLFGRIKDVSAIVRKEAFKTLSRLAVSKLSIKQRQQICLVGVRDRKDEVKHFVLNNLMLSWFKNCDCNYLSLLKGFYVSTMDADVLETILFQLFKKEPTTNLKDTIAQLQSKDKVIPVNSLTPENVTLWLYVIKYFDSLRDGVDDEGMSSKIRPELTRFTKYLKEFNLSRKSDDAFFEFLTIQLFKIALTYSYDDEMGREQLRVMSINYLMDENLRNDSIPAIVRVIEKLVPSVKDRLIMIAELTSDLRTPLLSSPMESMQSSVDNAAPENIEDQLSQLNCHSQDNEPKVETVIKCLSIILEVLKAKDVTKIDSTLLSLKVHFIVDCLESDNVEVLNLARNIMAIYCVWNLDIAKKYFLRFFFQLAIPGGISGALTCVIDMLLVHGFEPFSVPSLAAQDSKRNKDLLQMSLSDFFSDPSLTPSQVLIVTALCNFLGDEPSPYKAKACQGLAKLMLAGHLNSSLVLARLILVWFDPSNALEPGIRQALGVFLNVFATKRPDSGTIILNSMMPALKGANEITPKDDGDEIDPFSIAKFLVDLLRHDICLPPSNLHEGGSYHLRLASVVFRELLIVNGYDPILLSKLLPMIQFQPEDARCCSDLLLLVCRGIKKWSKFWDKRVLKSVQTFKSQLEKLKSSSSLLKNNDDVTKAGGVSSITAEPLQTSKMSDCEPKSNVSDDAPGLTSDGDANDSGRSNEMVTESPNDNVVIDDSDIENAMVEESEIVCGVVNESVMAYNLDESGITAIETLEEAKTANCIVDESIALSPVEMSRNIVDESSANSSSDSSDEDMVQTRSRKVAGASSFSTSVDARAASTKRSRLTKPKNVPETPSTLPRVTRSRKRKQP